MKYAYTYTPQGDMPEFVGPFDSYERMKKSIVSLIHEDDWGIGGLISDFLNDDPEYLMGALDIHIYLVDEEEFNEKNFNELCTLWRQELDRSNKRWIKEREEEEYRRDKEEYERLKKKFEE